LAAAAAKGKKVASIFPLHFDDDEEGNFLEQINFPDDFQEVFIKRYFMSLLLLLPA